MQINYSDRGYGTKTHHYTPALGYYANLTVLSSTMSPEGCSHASCIYCPIVLDICSKSYSHFAIFFAYNPRWSSQFDASTKAGVFVCRGGRTMSAMSSSFLSFASHTITVCTTAACREATSSQTHRPNDCVCYVCTYIWYFYAWQSRRDDRCTCFCRGSLCVSNTNPPSRREMQRHTTLVEKRMRVRLRGWQACHFHDKGTRN